MKRATWMMLATAALLLAASPALAADKGGVTMPDRAELAGESLVLNGMGIREATIFKVDVYVAGLYLPKRTSSAAAILRSDGAKRVIMHFVRDVDREDIVEAWREGFEDNAGSKYSAMRPKVARLESWTTDVEEDDRVILDFLPGEGVRLSANGKAMGTIPGEDFARVLMAIWLGPEPPNEGLKEGMLGKD
ncbi:MAG: chalcone isomerase family protein [Myxococcota bacterium]